ncbi:MAG: dihydropteroate synthase, partial [Bacteroidales bacterium]|nr:dihydropteroate synthase [Bacteroidales bacterium]
MGIINISPDSFYKGSRVKADDSILSALSAMVEAGADMIDVGGCSSRPGAEEISVTVEKERVKRVLSVIRERFPDLIVSLDTFRSEVALMGISDFGIDIINDISAFGSDSDMLDLVAENNIPYIMMHMQGTPSNMQNNPEYKDVVNDLLVWFAGKCEKLASKGVKDIIIDPGFGFGKTIDHNFRILNSLERFQILGFPVLVGFSRKSMIWKTLDTTPEGALPGTIVMNTVALMKGASIIRVHDVTEAKHAVKLLERMKAQI